MRRAISLFAVVIVTLLVTSCGGGGGGGGDGNGAGGTAMLHWTTPAIDVGGSAIAVAGYRIYYGTESGVYTNVIDVGNVTSYTVTGLATGKTYFFAVTAYGSDGVESDPTDEQAKTL